MVTASAFVTGLNADPLLNGYKLYVNGHFVNNGPGRGEAPVWGGDGKFRSLPYQTLDVTAHLSAGRDLDRMPSDSTKIELVDDVRPAPADSWLFRVRFAPESTLRLRAPRWLRSKRCTRAGLKR